MGRSARYSDDDIARAVEQSVSIAGVMRLLGIKRLELTSHFIGMGHNKGKRQRRRPTSEILVTRPDGRPLNCQGDNLRFLCPNCHSQTSTYFRTASSRRSSESA